MPISRYNSAYGGKSGSAAEAKSSMAKQYGAKLGERIFYATANRNRKRQGKPPFRRRRRRRA